MRPVFTAQGRAAVSALMAYRSALLAFDFDGTLAPIVMRPEDARVPLAVARRLAPLCGLRPVAVITGRSVADVSARLGFTPRFVIGNHGIEDPRATPARAWSAQLDPLRKHLRHCAAALVAAGVTVEDKAQSIALHYRLAADEARALSAIDQALAGKLDALQRGVGKSVVNLLPQGAPDKGDAVQALAQRCGAEAGLFIGGDQNDEPTFAKVPPAWVTVRVGADHARSSARYCIDGPTQLPILLQTMLDAARGGQRL